MRILIADHQTKVRFALRVALAQQPGCETIGEASNAEDLIAQVRAACPDLAIVDWELPDLPISDLIPGLRDICHSLRVIILSGRAETRSRALAAGANAFVCMCNAPDELSSALESCWG